MTGILTPPVRDRIVDIINEKVNIPLIGEGMEAIAFRRALEEAESAVQDLLRDHLGDDITNAIEVIISPDHTVEEKGDALTYMAEPLSALINEHVDIPFLNELEEGELIKAILTALLSALLNGISTQLAN